MPPQSSSHLVTEILLATPFDVQAAKEAISHHGARGELVLSLERIEQLSADALRKLADRILGVCVFAPPACSLIFSMLAVSDAEGRTYPFVGPIFGDYLSDEFPDTTLRFLELKAAEAAVNSPLRSFLDGLINHARERKRFYDELPKLKELIPAPEKRAALRIVKTKEQREIFAQAEEASIFALITTRVNLKYGRAMAMRRDGNFSESTLLNEHSFSIELPRSETRDPVMGVMRRGNFLRGAT